MIYNKKHYSKRVGVKSKEEALTHRGISHRRPTGPAKRTTGGESPPPTLATAGPLTAHRRTPANSRKPHPHTPQRPAHTTKTRIYPAHESSTARDPLPPHNGMPPGSRKTYPQISQTPVYTQHTKAAWQEIHYPPVMGCRPGSRE